MSLALSGHPFSSYTQKVLIALYENGIPFEFRCISPDTPQYSEEWVRRWPLRKSPLLADNDRNIVETRTRLLTRPAFGRAVDEARPYRQLFPLGAPDRD